MYSKIEGEVGADGMGSLRIELQVVDGNWELIWSKEGNQGNKWQQGGFLMSVRIRSIYSQ